MYNKFFSSVFTKGTSEEVPEADWVYKDSDNGLRDIEITKKIVSEKLDRLRDDKAAGSDDLLPRFLNAIKQEIVCPLVILFKKVLSEEAVPVDWKEAYHHHVLLCHNGSKNNTVEYRHKHTQWHLLVVPIFKGGGAEKCCSEL